MTKKILALLLALCLTAGGFILIPLAAESDDDGLILIFEENFEEYEKGVNVKSTLMPNFFVCEANAIGDGTIDVQETASGNLFLRSYVFTEVYTATPIVGTYEITMDVLEAQGTAQSGIFVRAPKATSAFYEGDGDANTSVCLSGLLLYPHNGSLGVNVKTYDPNGTPGLYLRNNTVDFNLPEGVSFPYTLRILDNTEEIAIYVNDTLICRVTYSDPGQVYDLHPSEGKKYGSAKLYDAAGNELAAYTNPLLSSESPYTGWTTRAAVMQVDNVQVKVEPAHQVLLTINQLPSKVTEKNIDDAKEIAEAARELYDSLPEDKKALVINYGKLTKAENSIKELEAVTEAPTDPVTEPETDPVTEAPTDEVTEPTETPTDPATEAPTNEPSADETNEVTDTPDNTEVKVIDDSLTIWILIAIMIVAICAAAGIITIKVRK